MEETKKNRGGPNFLRASSHLKKSTSPVSAEAKKKVIIKSVDMNEDVQQEAINCAISAFEKHNVEKDIAQYMKKEFDNKYGPTWHCIVGKNFGWFWRWKYPPPII